MGPHPVLTAIVALLGLIALAAALAMPWLGSAKQRERRRRIAAAVVGPYDEIWHPTGRAATSSWEAQVDASAPAPTPGDRPSDRSAEPPPSTIPGS